MRPNSCSLFTPATILPALQATSITSVVAVPSGSMAPSAPMVPIIRRSAKTRSWEKAEEFKRRLESEYHARRKGEHEGVAPEPGQVTVQEAVARFLASKRNENGAESTLDKLTTIFEKQFVGWATAGGLRRVTCTHPSMLRSLLKLR